MRIDVDTVLLERLFQPLADGLAAWIDCFGLARGALGAAVVLQFTLLAGDLQAFGDPAQRALAGAITLLALVGAQQAWSLIDRVERQARPGGMNVRRITLRWQRLGWLVVSIWSATLSLGRGDLSSLALCGTSMAWLSVIYFVSCTPAPPPSRRATWRPVCA